MGADYSVVFVDQRVSIDCLERALRLACAPLFRNGGEVHAALSTSFLTLLRCTADDWPEATGILLSVPSFDQVGDVPVDFVAAAVARLNNSRVLLSITADHCGYHANLEYRRDAERVVGDLPEGVSPLEWFFDRRLVFVGSGEGYVGRRILVHTTAARAALPDWGLYLEEGIPVLMGEDFVYAAILATGDAWTIRASDRSHHALFDEGVDCYVPASRPDLRDNRWRAVLAEWADELEAP